MSSRWFQTHLIRPLQSLLRSKRARPTVLLALLVVMPVAALAQTGGSPFDTGFTAIQTLFTGTIAKVASLVAIVIGGQSDSRTRRPRRPVRPPLPMETRRRRPGSHPACLMDTRICKDIGRTPHILHCSDRRA